MGFIVVTFGCKANQYDSQQWRRSLAEAGAVESGHPSLALVNTCAVTAEAERQARQAIRRLRRQYPGIRVVAAGCAVEVYPEKFSRMPEVDLALGRFDEEAVAGLARFLDRKISAPFRGLDVFGGHTRAFLKVQDGCDRGCSYCIVPRARGRPRSRDLAELVAEAQALVASGHKEIVLTGIRLGGFKPSLALLVRTLAGLEGLERLRLSSLEPDEVDQGLLEAMARSPRVAKHLHLPLQSGSDRILRLMARPYTLAGFSRILGTAVTAMPSITFGTDLIVGFPGEAEEDFAESLKAIEQLPISHLHLFAFSPRPGTEAARLPHQIPAAIKKERIARLQQAFAQRQRYFWSQRLGTVESVLFERQDRTHAWGWGEHYFKVRVRRREELRNQLRPVRLTAVFEGGLEGRVES